MLPKYLKPVTTVTGDLSNAYDQGEAQTHSTVVTWFAKNWVQPAFPS